MKRTWLLILIVVGLLVQSCTVDDLYQTLNSRWELKLPKATTIVDGVNNSGQKITSSTKNLDYIFTYETQDRVKLNDLSIWKSLTTREMSSLVKRLYAYLFADDKASHTPAEKMRLVEDQLGFKLDDNLRFFQKKDPTSPTGGQIILLYDEQSLQIHAFHFVE